MSRRQRPEHNYYFDKAAETTADSLAVLAEYRRTGTRNSGDVVKRGEKVLSEKGALRKLGDEVWPFLEQLAFAALDTGKIDLASVCVERLEQKFTNSSRVDSLRGLLLEVESPAKAREFYEAKLAKDENDVAIRKRLIALHLHCATSGAVKGDRSLSAARGIEMLVEHLETTYSDPDGWSELCAAYERLGMLPQALSCLADLILLQPTNTFHVLRHAEMLYTLGEHASAYKGFCRALEMAGPMSEGGIGRRAGFGVKLCLKRLGALDTEGASKRSVDATLPRKARDIDALVSQELLHAYGKAWDKEGDRVAGHDESKTLKIWLARQASSA